MTITARIIADTIWDGCPRLTTMELRYPRFIHAEFMTHRVFSRNAASSRAIPIARMIADIEADPAMPVEWGSNKPGMQAGPELTAGELTLAREFWNDAMRDAVDWARELAELGAHKQIANRLLEPFAHISVICTATDWDNFYTLRMHPDADPTIKALAEAMHEAMYTTDPTEDRQHTPYVINPTGTFSQNAFISAARCARVSYLNHDGTDPDVTKDQALAARLMEAGHWSPFEHQACVGMGEGTSPGHSNLRKWTQYRKILEG